MVISKSVLNTALQDPIHGVAMLHPFDRTTLTFRRVLFDAINTMTQEDQQSRGKDRYELGELAMRIAQASESGVKVSVEECAKLKERVGIIWSPVIVHQTHDMLEQLAEAGEASSGGKKDESGGKD